MAWINGLVQDHDNYCQTSNISRTLVGHGTLDHSDVVGSIACRRCSNYIFILGLSHSLNWLGKDNCKTRWETCKFGDLLCLILEVWWHTASARELPQFCPDVRYFHLLLLDVDCLVPILWWCVNHRSLFHSHSAARPTSTTEIQINLPTFVMKCLVSLIPHPQNPAPHKTLTLIHTTNQKPVLDVTHTAIYGIKFTTAGLQCNKYILKRKISMQSSQQQIRGTKIPLVTPHVANSPQQSQKSFCIWAQPMRDDVTL